MWRRNLGIETESLEYKKATGELKEAIISIASILNKHQKGELYFGVRNDGTPVGQIVNEKTLREISQAIANHIEPQIFPRITSVVIDGKDCIHLSFEGYNTPYFAYGIARLRVADEDLIMTRGQLESFFNSKNEDSWEKQLSSFSIDQVDENRVKTYINRGVSAGRIPFKYTDSKAALDKLMLLDGDRLLNAGMVLFCESLYAEIQMAIFAGKERLTFLDIQRERALIFELVEKTERYIASNIRWRVEFDGSLQRKEIPEIPMDAVREALMNSLCHKDYGACQSNEVTIHPDRIEIYNPGAFPVGLSPMDFIDGKQRPIRRNPLIASILCYSKDIESFGTGLKRIVDACKESNCRYEFEIQKSGFVVVFYRMDSGIKTQEQVNEQVNSNKIKLITFLKQNPTATYSSIAAELGVSYITARRLVHMLVDAGKIKRFGSDKKGGWKVLE